MKITLTLTKAEAKAVLRSQGLTNGNGVRKSIAIQMAQVKIIGAISAASITEEGKPKWADLYGADPDYCDGKPVDEWLEENRGEA